MTLYRFSDEEYYETEDLAARFDVTKTTVDKWCRLGLFPGAVPVGATRRRTWLIPAPAVEAFRKPSDKVDHNKK
jgi:hypothetical protein